jgi:hypothetical protein
MVRVTDRTWKRLHDQTHVRDYPEYVKRLRVPFALQQDIVSRGKEQRTCVFVRTVVSDLGR